MKKYLLILHLALSAFQLHAQVKPEDRILGVWLSQEKDGKIEIYKTGNKYFGKLIWGKEMYAADGKTSIKDTENSDPKLKARDLKDLVLLTNFIYQNDQWKDGKIYDPDSGKTYDCKMTLENGQLKIQGRVFIFTRTEAWTRVQ